MIRTRFISTSAIICCLGAFACGAQCNGGVLPPALDAVPAEIPDGNWILTTPIEPFRCLRIESGRIVEMRKYGEQSDPADPYGPYCAVDAEIIDAPAAFRSHLIEFEDPQAPGTPIEVLLALEKLVLDVTTDEITFDYGDAIHHWRFIGARQPIPGGHFYLGQTSVSVQGTNSRQTLTTAALTQGPD